MLEKACEENPDSTILVKTHPDAIASNKVKAYYANLVQTDRVKRLTDAINPISLIQQCDRVYVCTSQFGFEALMCGKDVQIFGRPFYAGYGVGTAAPSRRVEPYTNRFALSSGFYGQCQHQLARQGLSECCRTTRNRPVMSLPRVVWGAVAAGSSGLFAAEKDNRTAGFRGRN